MRKEKLEELKTYIEEFKAVKYELIERKPKFIEKWEELKRKILELENIKEKSLIEFVKRFEELEHYIKEVDDVKHDIPRGFLSFETYKVTLANGKEIIRDKMIKGKVDNNHPGASIILPVTKNKDIILVIQPRVFTKTTVGVEIPAGYIDKFEDPLAAAKRELEEETAYKSDNWINLLDKQGWYQDDGCSDSYNYSYLALESEKTGVQKLDKDEHIRVMDCYIDEAYEFQDMGYISGGGGIIALSKAEQYIKSR